jgi:adenosyl cobinamide kinase/adenosyl cobinamide phosphate guanylyltransferase
LIIDTPVKEVLFVYELTGEPQDEEMASRLEEHKKSTSWSLAFP